MKKPSRFLRLFGVAALLATLLAGVFGTSLVSAGTVIDPTDDPEVGDIWDGTDPAIQLNEGGVFFPWVGNDDESTGLGTADTSVSIMNIYDEPAIVWAFVGEPGAVLGEGGGWSEVGPFYLNPWASKTFTATDLGIADGAGAPVAFSGYTTLITTGSTCTTNLGGPLSAGNDVNGNGKCTDVEVYVGPDNEPYDADLCYVDDANGDPAPSWGDVFGGDNGGLNNDGDCVDAEGGAAGGARLAVPTVLGGYAKQVVDGETLPYTTAADTSVSGYNAAGGLEVRNLNREEDDWYFPIIQTNGGPGGKWNSIIRIANFGQPVVPAGEDEIFTDDDFIGASAVTISFFPADDAQGSLDTGFQLQTLLDAGEVWNIDVSDYLPEDWVGSAHVYSDSATYAMVDRVKPGAYWMWITNTASNAPYTNANNVSGGLGQYVLFAPDVRIDYFGWNTGINIANLVNEDNNVNIQYFNMYGNAPQTMTRRLAAQGMTYFYDPSIAAQDNSAQDPSADVNADVIGSGLIWSDYPVAAAVDATKYPESTTELDQNVFQAMSYSATGNVYTTQAFPLVQKGNPIDGMGATSGINIMNPNATAAQAAVYWINPSGFDADNFGTSAVAIPGFANGFVYTLTQGNLPNGFYGAALLNSTLPVAAVTTQVDYQVQWDGTAVWNGYNPCGYYRDNGGSELSGVNEAFDCNLGDPFNTAGGQVTKYVYDENGDPITGVWFRLVNEAYYQQEILGNENYAGIPWSGTGVSSVGGVVEWTNVPVGDYRLVVESIPTTSDNDMGDEDLPMYDIDPSYTEVDGWYVSEAFQLEAGDDIVIENEFDRILATKYVYLGEAAAGVEVCLHADDNDNGVLDDDEVTSPEDCDVADDFGDVVFTDIEPGDYYVSVNQGLEYDQVAGFNPEVYGPEYFGLGGVYVNDLGLLGAEGNLQKVIVLPAELCFQPDDMALAGDAGATCDDVSISGVITFYGPDGSVEAEGNVQSEYLDLVGPNDEPAFSLTDLNVKVGGPYEIEEDLHITYDLDGPGGDDPVTVDYYNYLETAEDGQVVCSGDYFEPTSNCEASPTDPEIYVFEDQTTRVFNDLTDIVEGQLDVFVRDEVTDLPLQFALVCAYDESNLVFVGCDLTDADGQAEFPGLHEGFYSLTAAHPDYEIQGSGNFYYWPTFDSFLGGGMDDELGDVDPFLGQQDLALALDPTGTFLDIQTTVGDAGVNNVPVSLYIAGPDDPGAGFCASGTLVGIVLTSNQAVSDLADDGAANGSQGPTEDGIAQFGVDPDQTYCAAADANGDGVIDFFYDIEAGVNPQAATNGGNGDFDDNDRNDDIDIVLADGGAGVADVQYVDGIPVNGIAINLYVADAADVQGVGGFCAGILVAGPVLTSTQAVSGQGNVAGIAEFPGVDTDLTYCADSAAGAETGINLDPADQADDIDGVIDVTVIVP